MLTRLSFLRRTLGAAFAGFLLTRPEPAEPMGLVAALDGAPDLWLRWLDQVDTFEELRGLRPTHFRCSHETMAELCKSFPVFSPLVGNKLRGVEWIPDSMVAWGLFEMSPSGPVRVYRRVAVDNFEAAPGWARIEGDQGSKPILFRPLA